MKAITLCVTSAVGFFRIIVSTYSNCEKMLEDEELLNILQSNNELPSDDSSTDSDVDLVSLN